MTAQALDAAGTDVRTTELFGYPLPPMEPGRRQVQHSTDGRYLVTDPDTGKQKPYTRMTTLVHTLDDDYHLRRWQRRQWATGGYVAGLSAALSAVEQAYARGARDRDDITDALADVDYAIGSRQAREKLADEAEYVVGMGRAAEFGTAVHEWTGHVDLGYPLSDVPDTDACVIHREVKGEVEPDGSPRMYRSTIRDRVADYIRVRTAAGLTPIPEMIERTVWTRIGTGIRKDDGTEETIEVVGTLDRIMIDADGNYVLTDLKTSPDMEYTHNSWSAQLTGYRDASYLLDPGSHEWVPVSGTLLDNVAGIAIIGLPSAPAKGAPIPVPVVTPLSVRRGRELLRLAARTRVEKRKARARDLALDAPALPVPAPGSDAQRRDALIASLQMCATLSDAAQVYADSADDIGRLGLLDYATWLAEHLS